MPLSSWMLIRGSPTQGVLKMAWLVPVWRGFPKCASHNFSDRRSERCSARVASGRGFCWKTPSINGTNSGTTFQTGPRTGWPPASLPSAKRRPKPLASWQACRMTRSSTCATRSSCRGTTAFCPAAKSGPWPDAEARESAHRHDASPSGRGEGHQIVEGHCHNLRGPVAGATNSPDDVRQASVASSPARLSPAQCTRSRLRPRSGHPGNH